MRKFYGGGGGYFLEDISPLPFIVPLLNMKKKIAAPPFSGSYPRHCYL